MNKIQQKLLSIRNPRNSHGDCKVVRLVKVYQWFISTQVTVDFINFRRQLDSWKIVDHSFKVHVTNAMLMMFQLISFIVIMLIHTTIVYHVSKKTVQVCFCQNFVKFTPILIIFGRKMAKRLKLYKLHSFSTSPNNLRHHTTVLNADVPNCYRTLKVVICNKLSNDLAHNKLNVVYLAEL